jgi:hypothetical protein
LRTLLAYLDDTLEPSEIKQIGQKVNESETAQKLIERIKQVTRRRRLTTPPLTGPGVKFDPNTVAEYLDNELAPEQVAELEKVCLESDVHLAEVAACHQILTLVLGEPPLIPPTAKERMYGLVQGSESIRSRKAPAAATTDPLGGDTEGDEALLFGSPFRKGSWMRWGLPAAILLLAVGLGTAFWQARPSANREAKVARNDSTTPDKGEAAKDAGKPAEVTPVDKPADKPADKPGEQPGDKPADKPGDQPGDKGPGQPGDRPDKPSDVKKVAGNYSGAPGGSGASVLVRRDGQTWRRLTIHSPVSTTETLVSLPGYPSELRLNNGVRVQQWGTVPEFFDPNVSIGVFLFESALTLHDNPNFDADLTLDRGRFYIANTKDKGPARVRLRFLREVWDLTLDEPDSEVAIDLIKRYTPDTDYQGGEEPRADLYLTVVQGKAGLRMDGYHEYPNLSEPPGPAFFSWDNKGAGARGPLRFDKRPPSLSKEIPTTAQAKPMRVALDELSVLLTPKKALDVALLEGRQKDAAARTLSIYSLGAIDAIPQLLDILSDEDPEHGPDRLTAIFTLRRWIGRGTEQGKLLYDPATRKGILIDRKYRASEAAILFDLLHDFTYAQRRQPETFQLLVRYMREEKIALRELAYWHLVRLSLGVKDLPPYNPAWGPSEREASCDGWKKLIASGALPPPERPPAPPPGGAGGPPPGGAGGLPPR